MTSRLHRPQRGSPHRSPFRFRPPGRAEPAEILARWSPPPTLQKPAEAATAPALRTKISEIDDAAEHTVVTLRRKGRPFPVLRFSNGQTLTVDTSALVGRNPAANDGESVAALFGVEDASRTVSKTHFRIDWHDDQLMIIDRHSGNGIAVERGLDSPKTLVPMTSFELRHEDHVLIGDQAFTVAIQSPPTEDGK
ncbi:FHA domain-containing protein [Cryobacterium sp. MDB2-33-2]|nr:FHA domain-containing protein [Cryobacterium sp. MDB2-33-2]